MVDNVVDDYFDELDTFEYHNMIEDILGWLCYIVIGLPLLATYYVLFNPRVNYPYIQPYGRINYIFANYQNIITESKESENVSMCNRWNYNLCESEMI